MGRHEYNDALKVCPGHDLGSNITKESKSTHTHLSDNVLIAARREIGKQHDWEGGKKND